MGYLQGNFLKFIMKFMQTFSLFPNRNQLLTYQIQIEFQIQILIFEINLNNKSYKSLQKFCKLLF